MNRKILRITVLASTLLIRVSTAEETRSLSLHLGKVTLAAAPDAYPVELRGAVLKNSGASTVKVSSLIVQRLDAAGLGLQLLSLSFSPALTVAPRKAVNLPLLRAAVIEAKGAVEKKAAAGSAMAETEAGVENVVIEPAASYDMKALAKWQSLHKSPTELGVPPREDALREYGPLLLFAQKRRSGAKTAMILFRDPGSATVFAPPAFCGGRTFAFRGPVPRSGGEFKLDPSGLPAPVCEASDSLFRWVQGTPPSEAPALPAIAAAPAGGVLNHVAVFRFFPSKEMTKATVDVVYAAAKLTDKGIVFAPPLDRHSLGSPILAGKSVIGIVNGPESGTAISAADTLRWKPVEAPIYTLRIVSEPDLARVFIKDAKGVWQPQLDREGRPLLTPATLRLPAGEYFVELRKNGYAPRTRSAAIKLDKGLEWTTSLERAKPQSAKPEPSKPTPARLVTGTRKAPEPAPSGEFRLTTNPPGATVTVGQNQLPALTPTRVPLAGFPVLIRLKAPGDLFCSLTLTQVPRSDIMMDLTTCGVTFQTPSP